MILKHEPFNEPKKGRGSKFLKSDRDSTEVKP